MIGTSPDESAFVGHRKHFRRHLKALSFFDQTASKKYVNIHGKVSKDKWTSMFRYLAKYVEIPCLFPSLAEIIDRVIKFILNQ